MLNFMSPLKICLLLELQCKAYPEVPNTPAHNEAIRWFKEHGLITEEEKVTEKGVVYISALLNVPLPVATWVIPKDV